MIAMGSRNIVNNLPFGNALAKYQNHGEVPYSLDRLSTVLKSNTSPSGHIGLCHNIESMGTVHAREMIPAKIPI